MPQFRERLRRHKGGAFQGNYVCACPDSENARGEHLLAIVDHTMLPRILSHLLNEHEFLRPTVSAASAGSTPSVVISACCPASAKR